MSSLHEDIPEIYHTLYGLFLKAIPVEAECQLEIFVQMLNAYLPPSFMQVELKANPMEAAPSISAEMNYTGYKKGRRPITVFLHCNPEAFDYVKFDPKLSVAFAANLAKVLCHEIIHFMQFDSRPAYSMPVIDDNGVTRDYLSAPDEIDAYAHCCYMGFLTQSSDDPIAGLRCYKNYKIEEMQLYAGVFDIDDKVMRRLLKKVYQWHRIYNNYKKETRRMTVTEFKDWFARYTASRGDQADLTAIAIRVDQLEETPAEHRHYHLRHDGQELLDLFPTK